VNGGKEFWSTGVQEFRSSGVQEFRSSGVQEFRKIHVQKKEFESQDRLLGIPNMNRKEFATDDKGEIGRFILQLLNSSNKLFHLVHRGTADKH
jgi:hypothetical protein